MLHGDYSKAEKVIELETKNKFRAVSKIDG